MTRIPTAWASSSDVAKHFGISTRHLRSLRRDWEERGLLLEGKHFWLFSPRVIRFDLDAMTKLAHSQGRIIRS